LNELYKEGLLDKFETRYAIYDPSKALKNLNKALAKGQLFEYEWLVAKRETYQKQADKEIKRIQKTIEKLEKDVSLLSNKLSNEKFVQNADEDVVAADRILLRQSKEQVVSLKDALTRFQ
jgi:valyl-tRNA synthetase